MDHTDAPADTTQSKRSTWLRIGALALFFIGTYVIAWATGAQDLLTLEGVREMVGGWGVFGWVIYLVVFSAGELMHIPGFIFVGAGIAAYGKVLGGILSFVGSIVSVSVSFIVVRGVGGRPLTQLRWAFARRALARLDERPVSTVFILRLMFFMAPPLNYALALSGVRFRDYLLGSLLGLVIPVTVIVLAFDWVFATWLN